MCSSSLKANDAEKLWPPASCASWLFAPLDGVPSTLAQVTDLGIAPAAWAIHTLLAEQHGQLCFANRHRPFVNELVDGANGVRGQRGGGDKRGFVRLL
jgi:hypothetical protein